MPKQVNVTVLVNGTSIELDSDLPSHRKGGGNAHLKLKDQVRWHIDDLTKPFTLTFTDLDTGAAAQPFGASSYGPTADTGWLTATNADHQYCKYDVSIDGCDPLDPIIIVDKDRSTPIRKKKKKKKSNRKTSGRTSARKAGKKR